ncbi:MAG: hypothetical protein JXR91_00310 [Deltaproteobacteria bacterium]|nr:hypothetical protein [Deltaproteobacteria bacterium]
MKSSFIVTILLFFPIITFADNTPSLTSPLENTTDSATDTSTPTATSEPATKPAETTVAGEPAEPDQNQDPSTEEIKTEEIAAEESTSPDQNQEAATIVPPPPPFTGVPVQPSNTTNEYMPPRPRKGLMIAGWAILGGGWAFSVLTGAMLLSEMTVDPGEECLNCTTTGSRLMIPLAGPFLAIPYADEGAGQVVAGTLGIIQVTGLIIGIVGTAKYSFQKKRYYNQSTRLQINAGATSTSAAITASFRF